MKTPEEIKTGMQRYINAGSGVCLLDECPLDSDVLSDALTYIHQLEETIMLMKLQMRGDCGCCKHGRDGDMATCNKCLTMREYHPLWEYEGLPEVESHDKPV